MEVYCCEYLHAVFFTNEPDRWATIRCKNIAEKNEVL